jgi:hypothetical protein
MTERSLDNVLRENRILRELVGTLSTVVQEIFEAMPPEYQALENAQRAIALTTSIRTRLQALGEVDNAD